ncbi:MAG: MoxR family ATPase [Chitinophagaceae bacterium]|jgi:MoxR-like ATPase|nr:MoxR family ATPase [Chitinophagaceae bacterium]
MENNVTTASAQQNIERLIANIEKVIKGKADMIRFILTALISRGHILLEDNPGTGKTVMAKTLAKSISSGTSHQDSGILFHRIQFTPDLLPMDLIGSHIFDDKNKEFIFKKGPLFTNILLADEINRASPKVQSALLECMAENQITVGDVTHRLHDMFFTIATQNPIEMEGTYPLPTAQLDRFSMKIIFGYVDEQTEMDIYKDYLGISNNFEHIEQVLSLEEILHLQSEADHVHIDDEIVASVRNIIVNTRKHPDITLGASTRSGITLLKCLRAYALVKGRDYVTEEDIHTLVHPVLHHRLIFRNKDGQQNSLKNILSAELDRLHKIKK